MTTCIGKRFCGSDGDISDTLFDNGVSVSRRICSKNSSKESRSRWRTTSSYNLYEEFYLENESRQKKQITCLIDKIMLEEYLHMIYHEYDPFYQYWIVEEEMKLMNHLKMIIH